MYCPSSNDVLQGSLPIFVFVQYDKKPRFHPTGFSFETKHLLSVIDGKWRVSSWSKAFTNQIPPCGSHSCLYPPIFCCLQRGKVGCFPWRIYEHVVIIAIDTPFRFEDRYLIFYDSMATSKVLYCAPVIIECRQGSLMLYMERLDLSSGLHRGVAVLPLALWRSSWCCAPELPHHRRLMVGKMCFYLLKFVRVPLNHFFSFS